MVALGCPGLFSWVSTRKFHEAEGLSGLFTRKWAKGAYKLYAGGDTRHTGHARIDRSHS